MYRLPAHDATWIVLQRASDANSVKLVTTIGQQDGFCIAIVCVIVQANRALLCVSQRRHDECETSRNFGAFVHFFSYGETQALAPPSGCIHSKKAHKKTGTKIGSKSTHPQSGSKSLSVSQQNDLHENGSEGACLVRDWRFTTAGMMSAKQVRTCSTFCFYFFYAES